MTVTNAGLFCCDSCRCRRSFGYELDFVIDQLLRRRWRNLDFMSLPK